MSNTFEHFIMQCCKAPEGKLRKWLRKILERNNFTVVEDGYISDRAKMDREYSNVHNMLAIRSEDPTTIPYVCLVAHTDVCRDHNRGNAVYSHYVQGQKQELKNIAEKPFVEPVLKRVRLKDNSTKIIIQDKQCKTQVGGDDRLGVAINMWIALNTGYDMGLLFTTDEESGLLSARAVDFPELNEFALLCQVDRGNHTDQLVNKINGDVLADYDTTARLLEVAFDMKKPRSLVNGAGTDVQAIKSRGKCKNAVNMTCGYHNSVGDNPNEYIDIEEARDTMMYVSKIIQNYEVC